MQMKGAIAHQVLWYNRLALSREWSILLAFVLLIAMTGCSTPGASSGAQGTVTLMPYASATSSPQPNLVPIPTLLTPTQGPTPTPFTHQIQDGETLYYIAYLHGVTVEDILAANPGIDPHFLTIGSTLIIPIADHQDVDAQLPVVTPVPVELDTVSCFRTPSDGLWCLTMASAGDGRNLEGLSATITLTDALGQAVASAVAYSPLNLLEAGKTMPLGVFFPPPSPEYTQATATLMTAFELAPENDRYLPVEADMEILEAVPESTYWRLGGTVSLTPGANANAARIAMLVLALGETGGIVGFNMWESGGVVTPGQEIVVQLDLFSLGPPIRSIQILTEALAAP
jgi:LysM repeat protein